MSENMGAVLAISFLPACEAGPRFGRRERLTRRPSQHSTSSRESLAGRGQARSVPGRPFRPQLLDGLSGSISTIRLSRSPERQLSRHLPFVLSVSHSMRPAALPSRYGGAYFTGLLIGSGNSGPDDGAARPLTKGTRLTADGGRIRLYYTTTTYGGEKRECWRRQARGRVRR